MNKQCIQLIYVIFVFFTFENCNIIGLYNKKK